MDQISNSINTGGRLEIRSYSLGELQEQLIESVNLAQTRMRSRLVDHDDIGEFIQELPNLFSAGVFCVKYLGACPTKVANSYNGRAESTILQAELVLCRINPKRLVVKVSAQG